MCCLPCSVLFFSSSHTAASEIYTLSLHDALPISRLGEAHEGALRCDPGRVHASPLPLPDRRGHADEGPADERSEEHTSELQSHSDLVCRLLLEKKKSGGGRCS